MENIEQRTCDDLNNDSFSVCSEYDLPYLLPSLNASFEQEKETLSINAYALNEHIMNILKNSSRLRSILYCNYYYNNVNTHVLNIKECSICFTRIKKYGLLSNCDDVFCYDCIKQWRREAVKRNKRDLYRRCPICQKESFSVIFSKEYLTPTPNDGSPTRSQPIGTITRWVETLAQPRHHGNLSPWLHF